MAQSNPLKGLQMKEAAVTATARAAETTTTRRQPAVAVVNNIVILEQQRPLFGNRQQFTIYQLMPPGDSILNVNIVYEKSAFRRLTWTWIGGIPSFDQVSQQDLE